MSQVSYIVNHGADEYRKIGTENSKGTKVFALAGKVRHGGLIEVPMGTTLNQIIEDIGGGVEGGEKLRAVQIGGPSGGCIPAHLCDAKVDFDALTQMGAIMGSGGMVVLMSLAGNVHSAVSAFVGCWIYWINYVPGKRRWRILISWRSWP